ncbi:MAG: YheU family protein [Steroidobacteraceae bacterium]
MEKPAQTPVVVPYSELDADLLRSVIESFVLREGTDYGEREISLADKVERVIRQLERGDAQIIFDPQTETVDIAAVRRR